MINNGGFRLSTNSTVAGTIVEYYCLSNSRYRMSGPSRLVCQSDGHYDRDPPVCIGKLRLFGDDCIIKKRLNQAILLYAVVEYDVT